MSKAAGAGEDAAVVLKPVIGVSREVGPAIGCGTSEAGFVPELVSDPADELERVPVSPSKPQATDHPHRAVPAAATVRRSL